MSEASDLVAQIAASLSGTVSPNLTVTDPLWDLYEAYVFSCVLRAAIADGYTVVLRHGNDQPLPAGPGGTTRFVIRRGPGVIYSTEFSYAVATNGSVSVEAHIGVRVDGQSGVAHECDVSVLDQSEAELARGGGFHPRARGVVLACECKYYTGGLPLSLLREFLGLTTDLRSQSMRSRLISNVTHPAAPSLMKHHHRDWTDEMTPGTRAQTRFEGIVEDLLHRYRR